MNLNVAGVSHLFSVLGSARSPGPVGHGARRVMGLEVYQAHFDTSSNEPYAQAREEVLCLYR